MGFGTDQARIMPGVQEFGHNENFGVIHGGFANRDRLAGVKGL